MCHPLEIADNSTTVVDMDAKFLRAGVSRAGDMVPQILYMGRSEERDVVRNPVRWA